MIKDSFRTSNTLASKTDYSSWQRIGNISFLKLVHNTIYIAALLGLIGITIHETYQCFNRYLRVPTYTDMTIVYQEEADFPSVTFCPLWDNYAFKRDVLQVSIQ